MGLVLQRIRLVFQILIRLKDQTNYYLNPLRACPPSVRHSYGEIHSQHPPSHVSGSSVFVHEIIFLRKLFALKSRD
jgi:hypothetical protein